MSLGVGATTRRVRTLLGISAVALGSFSSVVVVSAQRDPGRIEGRVTREDGSGVAGASIVLNETISTAITGNDGEFSFSDVPPGTYSLTIVLGENLVTISATEVSAGRTTTVEETVDWDAGFTDTLVVVGASRRLEGIVEAPAAATRVVQDEIQRTAFHGQLPKVLEFTPGAQLTQGGLYDFNFNTRGFNANLNRRVAVRLDGRDLSVPFFAFQDWTAFSSPLDDLSSVEFVRGPSAALYGANASGGVLNLTTREPRFNPGGMVRVAFGHLSTINLDARWAGELGSGWYGRVAGGVRDSTSFAASRNIAPEYSVPCIAGVFGDCLPQETVPLARDDIQIVFGGLRVDKYLNSGLVLTMEGGHAETNGALIQTPAGRVQTIGRGSARPWARLNVNADRFNVMTSYSGNYTPDILVLGSGSGQSIESHRFQVEGQTNWKWRQDSVRVVLGGSAGVDRIDTLDPRLGRQTVLFAPVKSDQQAVFGQADWNITDQVKLVLAGRGDWSSLHDVQFSPKGSVIYTLAPNHSVRFSYNEAFQVPDPATFFLEVDVAAPVDLSPLNAFCAPFDIDCGFGSTRIAAVGNEELEVEENRTWELGYKGILSRRAFVTLDYYRANAFNFVTSLLPQLGTPLGRVSPRFGPWKAPEGLPDQVADQIRSVAPPILSNRFNGSPILAAASFGNFGRVNTQGVDIGLLYAFPAGWQSSFTYSWFDFEIQERLPGLEALLLPNAPEHTFSVGLTYDGERFDASVDIRWVDEFRWSVGLFQGQVASYTTVDMTADYPLSDEVSLRLNVANMFDNRHWQSFGGDILRRRALLSLEYGW